MDVNVTSPMVSAFALSCVTCCSVLAGLNPLFGLPFSVACVYFTLFPPCLYSMFFLLISAAIASVTLLCQSGYCVHMFANCCFCGSVSPTSDLSSSGIRFAPGTGDGWSGGVVSAMIPPM